MVVETPTAVAAGVVLALFGSALLLWCALELRLRHRLRAHGTPAVARVVADPDGQQEAFDSAPLLSYLAHAPAVPHSGRELRVVSDEHELTVLARPRGSTRLSRPAKFVPGMSVQVAYDARRPDRVVLAGPDDVRSLAGDLLWALLGVCALAGGAALLGRVLAG